MFGPTIALALVCLLGLSSSLVAAQGVKELTDQEFYDLKEDKERCLLVLAHASWSYQSKHAKVVMQKLADWIPTSNFSEISVGLLDVHKYRRLARMEAVVHPPTFLFYTFGASDSTHYGFHDKGNVVAEMVEHITLRLEDDRTHRMLEQERAVEDAKWKIPHPNPGNVIDFESEDAFYLMTHDITRTVMVLFYANWCEGCKEYASEYADLAKAFLNEPKVVIAKLDAEKFPGLADKYKVDGYPTLLLFTKNREGKVGHIYQGDREASHLTGLITQYHQTPVDYSGHGGKLLAEMEKLMESAMGQGDGEQHPMHTQQGEEDEIERNFPEDGRI